MDSGNTSGSMQSSSGGGDEEYDSRAAADPISTTFLTTTNHHHHHHHQSSSSLLFDPPNFFTNNHNLDNMGWPRPAIRSDPNPSDLISAITHPRPLPSNFPPPIHHHGTNPIQPAPAHNPGPNPTQNDANGTVVRNPKKRSRASRRAPTTVLTTDTTNFRAMVQEFTGIPAPPFASSPFSRTRLDLFGSGSGSPLLSANNAASLLRPFAQKPPQFVVSNSPVLGFNSLLQAPPKFPALHSKPNATALIIDEDDHHFALHANPFAPNWPASGNDNSASGNDANTAGFLSSINAGFVGTAGANSEQVLSASNGKTTSDFHVGSNKVISENSNVVAVARSEGMVESWICSSD